MDKKQMMKWAAIALAAYLVWRYFQANGGFNLFGGQTAQPQLPGGSDQPQPSDQTGTGTGQQPANGANGAAPPPAGGNGSQTTGTGTQVVPSDEDLMAAAYNPAQAGKTGAYKLNFHQWNWYRMQAAIAATGGYVPEQHQPAWDGILDPNSLVTAAEYQSALAQRGLSGRTGWSSGYSAPGMGMYVPGTGRGIVQ